MSEVALELPTTLRTLIENELTHLSESPEYSLSGETRTEIYSQLGPSNLSEEGGFITALKTRSLPVLSIADRVRIRISLATARKVEPLWSQACTETEVNSKEPRDLNEVQREEEIYVAQRRHKHIENISVYDVPRQYTLSHILEMAEMALKREIHDVAAFVNETNEWWGIYPRPELMERECFLKWAAQEPLYMAVGGIESLPDPPATPAILAVAGIFEGDDFNSRTCRVDKKKEHEFWIWWLSDAIPSTMNQERMRR